MLPPMAAMAELWQWKRGTTLARLADVMTSIEKYETTDIGALRRERDRLIWELEEGDHS